MNNFKEIQLKLIKFINKYYKNELIRGSILFFSFGLLYLFFTLFIEFFLWLPIIARTALFYTFLIVEITLLIKFIIVPITKLYGLQKGISFTYASKIIGKHFKEVDDKLLNVLQLGKSNDQTELLLASIEQKSASLKPSRGIKKTRTGNSIGTAPGWATAAMIIPPTLKPSISIQ